MTTIIQKPKPSFPGKRQEMYENYLRHLSRKDVLRPYSFTGYVRRFLEFLGRRELSKEAVEEFMLRLQEAGLKTSSRRFVFGVLRSFFHINGIEWPFGRGDAPRLRGEVADAPALHPEAVRKMIRTAVEGKYGEDEAACLALVTTYGLRREEITRLTPEHLLVKERLLQLLDPAKNGQPRLHVVPEEILPYLRAWGFRTPLTINALETMWYMLERKAGLPHVPRVGFHAVRRSLNSELRMVANATTVALFMGWRSASSPNMSDRYIKTTYVGWGEGQVVQPTWRREIDEEIFKVHPFLAAWREI